MDLKTCPCCAKFEKNNPIMKEPQKNPSDVVYALVGAFIVAIVICTGIAIIKPIVNRAKDARLARQEEQVSVLKNFLNECADTTALSTVCLNGYLLDGKKQLKIATTLAYEVENYHEYSLSGSYRYMSQKEDNRIGLSGTCELIGRTLHLVSDSGTEVFDLAYNEENQSFEGTWSEYKNKRKWKKNPDSFEKRLDCHLYK